MKRLLLLPFLILATCKSKDIKDEKEKPSTASTVGVESSSDLDLSQAQERKRRLSQVTYKVSVQLGEKEKTYSGQSEIRFQLSDTTKPLRVDFFEGKVNSLTLNGQTLPVSVKKPYWIELPATALKTGDNVLVVNFTHEYSQTGQGLHRFVDPQSKDVFLYTQFETFDANRFMPCFDQPDLRARFTLQVEAPTKWQVISTTRETQIKKMSKARKLWTFPETPEISTYLFSLHAGPYTVWTDKFEDIPLRLFARPTMAKYARVKEWFTYTKQGLKFYNSYFGYRYPFKKYDQIVVPEFNAGAMENVAAITFTENFLWRAQPTRRQLRGLASVILHEMAHMWFGDIVTMKWWNDLWLNESFATHMASLALAEATEFKESWQASFAGDKRWAYWEDSLITTHPIEAPVKSVKDAFGNFDGITYGKGAAVLKQLSAYITPEAFQKGIQAYIQRYAFKNAELKEFTAALQEQTPRDLSEWSERWLRQSGTDKVAAHWTCTNDTLNEVELIVTPSAGAKFRPQTVKLALFQEKDGALADVKAQSVDLLQARTVVKGPWPCPAFVYPNYEDEGYVGVRLDTMSLQYAKRSVGRIPDLLLRTMVWNDLWEMVRNTEMPLKDYVAILREHLPKEDNPILLDEVVSSVGRVIDYWPQTDERLRADRMTFISELEKEYLSRFQAAKAGSDDQRVWFDHYIGIAQTPAALDVLAKWATQKDVAKGMPLDLDRQWAVVRSLVRYQHPKGLSLLEAQKKRDPSDRGQKQALSTEAVQPELKVKEKWVTLLKEPKPQMSLSSASSVLRALFPFEQKTLAKRFEKDFYDYISRNGRSENELLVESFARGLSPLNCTSEDSSRLKTFLQKPERFTPSLAKQLRVSVDEDERCQRIRAMSSL